MEETTLICYRGACTNAAHPCGYNRVTHGLYCLDCARLIEESGMVRLNSSPAFPLLKFSVTDGGAYVAGLIRVRLPKVVIARDVGTINM